MEVGVAVSEAWRWLELNLFLVPATHVIGAASRNVPARASSSDHRPDGLASTSVR
jgi:hypothetical protein